VLQASTASCSSRPNAEGYALPLQRGQIDSCWPPRADWTTVEPAIFGTLLERALHPASATPWAPTTRRAPMWSGWCIPTVMEPLRAEWSDAQAAALLLSAEAAALAEQADQLRDALTQRQLLNKKLKINAEAELDAADKHEASARAKRREAVATVKAFHHRLCSVRVLDPACGSGNFLYVTLEHLKRLEGEVLNQLEALDSNLRTRKLESEAETVTLQQLRGIELNPRAAALAELVLWIGYLQWQVRTVGLGNIIEPVVHDYGNIEHRDAVLASTGTELLTDAAGRVVMRWDGVGTRPHPVTGLPVPDENAQQPQWRYLNPRKANWPEADFIVGNPPFIGASTMRAALGDGYVDALRSTWPEVPESADFVMYWWHQAAQTVAEGRAQRFGLITTNSIKQTFNRRVVQAALPGVSLIYAIPDHPWVDSANGAAVRIAMTAGQAGEHVGRLLTVHSEATQDDGEVAVGLNEARGLLHADLRMGANVAAARRLLAMTKLSHEGIKPHGMGFVVTDAQRGFLETDAPVNEYRNGRDMTDRPRGLQIIDLFGLSAEEVRQKYPKTYQWVLERVKPERDQNNRSIYRDNWWIFGEPRKEMRPALSEISRYIATVKTSKHRTFQFLQANVLPDSKVIAIASADALHLGILSSSVHVAWATAAGSNLGAGNDPTYVKSASFETFPFPSEDTGLTPALTERIRSLAEQLDAHRKRQQAAHPELTLTGMYNVQDKLRQGQALNAKEQALHQQGLVSVLRNLHDELDAAVMQAYGWSELGPAPFANEAARSAWTEGCCCDWSNSTSAAAPRNQQAPCAGCAQRSRTPACSPSHGLPSSKR
jgi:hypothetical protein